MARVRVAFASKNFQSGQQVRFRLFDKFENLVSSSLANEWANTGVYYKEYNLPFGAWRSYLVVAEELTGSWKATKLITRYDRL